MYTGINNIYIYISYIYCMDLSYISNSPSLCESNLIGETLKSKQSILLKSIFAVQVEENYPGFFPTEKSPSFTTGTPWVIKFITALEKNREIILLEPSFFEGTPIRDGRF